MLSSFGFPSAQEALRTLPVTRTFQRLYLDMPTLAIFLATCASAFTHEHPVLYQYLLTLLCHSLVATLTNLHICLTTHA